MVFLYELSQDADDDLVRIYDYTSEQFGNEQAIKYLTGLEDIFQNLCKNPLSGRNRNEIAEGIRSISFVSHVVFYKLKEEKLLIVRVLHASRDVTRYFPQQE